jgi:hypothetical protein
MAEPSVGHALFVITIETGSEYFFVPGEHAIVGAKGIFVRNVELRVGTPVGIQVCKKQESVTLRGVVRASYPDLGIAIEFKERTGRAARQLLTLLAT